MSITKSNCTICNMGSCCFARDTEIKLADGRMIRADEIKIGERLACYSGKSLTVTDILTGEEKKIYHIKTRNGAEIKLTSGHILLRGDNDRVAVSVLSPGDKIMTENKTLTDIISVEEINYKGMVYNFMFEGEHEGNFLIANGFFAGDFYAQNMQSDNEKKLATEHQAMLKEFEQLKELLKK